MKVKVLVWQESKDKWIATIAGGWWTAISNTKEKAIDAVIKRFEGERDYFARNNSC